MLTGYDISNHQAGLNLAKLQGLFFIMKATEGVGFVDRYCEGFVRQAKQLGRLYGVYHFLDQSDVVAQADFFVKHIKGYLGEALLVLDYEMYGRQGPAQAKRFLDRVYQLTGVKPLIYMSESVTREEDWSAVVKADYGLWVAKYAKNQPKVGYWPSYAMWQFTSTPYDKNYFYGDQKAWRAYTKPKKPAPVAKPKPETAKPKPKPEEGGIKMKTFVLNTNVYLRKQAKRSAETVALLTAGQSVKINDVVMSEGFIWGVQPRSDGTKGYLALGKVQKYGQFA